MSHADQFMFCAHHGDTFIAESNPATGGRPGVCCSARCRTAAFRSRKAPGGPQ